MKNFNRPLIATVSALIVLSGCATQQSLQSSKNTRSERHDQPGEAAEFYRLRRVALGESGIPVETRLQARENMRQMPRYSSVTKSWYPSEASGFETRAINATWSELGPGNVGGRTRSMVIDPTDPNIMYVGAVGGGVWKTTNAGTNWSPISDTISNIAVASLAMDPANPQILYAGTGEGSNNIDAIRGAGIFKTINGGTSWTRLASTTSSDFYFVNDVLVAPNNAQQVVAATSTGIWVSIDGGTNFTRNLNTARCLDLAVTTISGTDTWLASCGNFSQATVYRSTNLTTWTPVLTETDMGRTSVAIRGNRAYALASSRTAGFDRNGSVAGGDYLHQLHAFFKSEDGGLTWSATVRNNDAHHGNTMLLSGYFSCANLTLGVGQGWYDNVVNIDPADVNIVWVAGVHVFRSNDSGANWGRADNIHPDHHGLFFHPQYNGTTNQILFNTQDGGLYRTNNARASVAGLPSAPGACTSTNAVAWSSLNNGYAGTQFYHGTAYPDGSRYFAGAQDNGIQRGDDVTGPNSWQFLTCGDGGYTGINPANTNVLYASCQNVDILKSTNGTNFSSADSGITASEGSIFIPPFAVDPNNAQNLWFGGARAWRTIDAAGSWTGASTTFGSDRVTAIAIAPGNSNVVLMSGNGSGNSRVYRTTTGLADTNATVWSASANISGYISAIAFAPNNASIVYLSVSTFGATHVLKSIDGGVTFVAAAGSGGGALPDVPAMSVVVHPDNANQVYVGTDIGVFVSIDGGANWAPELNGLPNVSTEWLSIIGSGQTAQLFAFTHGRGTFKISLASGPGTLEFQSASSQAFEASTNASVTLRRINGSTGAVSVNYQTTPGSATSPSDFTTQSGSVNWADGDSSNKTISIPLTDDLIAESDETFSIAISGPSGGATLGTSTHTVTIKDGDGEIFPAQCQLPAGWTGGGWSVVSGPINVVVSEGSCSLRANAIGNSQNAQIEFTGTFTASNITFKRRVSSEAGWDCLRFYVDNVQQNIGGTCTNIGGIGASGDVAWGSATVAVTAGVHTIRWSYEKDTSDIGLLDTAWIDEVVLPLAISGTLPDITSASPLNGSFGTLYTHNYVATGSPAPSYAVQTGSLPGGLNIVASSITGTPNAVGTFTGSVRASNTSGTDDQSFNIVIAAVAPTAPTITSATPGSGSASFTMQAPSNSGGVSISNYTVTCNPGNFSNTSPSPVSLTGLANNTTYTCSATATNSASLTSPPSATLSVTPTDIFIFSNGFE